MKRSDLFEGPQSSLKQAYDEAVKPEWEEQFPVTMFKTDKDGTWFCMRINPHDVITSTLKARDNEWLKELEGMRKPLTKD
jgi:hypothetical protein